MTTPADLARQGQAHLARVRELLGPLRARGHDAWDVPILERLPSCPEAAAEWDRAVAVWWQLAQTRTRDIVLAEAKRLHRAVSARYALEDLVQAGWVGAFRAAQKWDPTQTSSWRPWAGRGISMHIRLHLRQGQTELVAIPENKRAHRWTLHRAEAELERRGLPRELPLLAEIAGVDPEVARDVLGVDNVVHLDAPVSGDGDGDRHAFVAGDEWDPTDKIASEQAITTVRAALATLPPRYRELLELRMEGLGLVDVGQRFGVTREAARQQETRAMRALGAALGVEGEVGVTAKEVPLTERVFAAVTRGAARTDQIADATGLDRRKVNAVLNQLSRRGSLVRVGGGEWRLP